MPEVAIDVRIRELVREFMETKYSHTPNTLILGAQEVRALEAHCRLISGVPQVRLTNGNFFMSMEILIREFHSGLAVGLLEGGEWIPQSPDDHVLQPQSL